MPSVPDANAINRGQRGAAGGLLPPCPGLGLPPLSSAGWRRRHRSSGGHTMGQTRSAQGDLATLAYLGVRIRVRSLLYYHFWIILEVPGNRCHF